MSTFSAKPSDVRSCWYIADATGKTLGRFSAKIAMILQGKNKPEYTPHVDTGDYIIVINAEKINVTGDKEHQKMYYQHSGYPGGMKSSNFAKLLAKAPERIIETAVKGMLPKGPLGREMFRKLKVYVGDQHPHEAQQPQPIDI